MNGLFGDSAGSIVYWQMMVKILIPLLSFTSLLASYYIASSRKHAKALEEISAFLKEGFKTEIKALKDQLEELQKTQCNMNTDISILKDRYPRGSVRINTDDDDDDIVNMGEYLPTKREFIEAQNAIKSRKKRKIDNL